MLSLNVNGRDHQVDVEPEMPLLWVLREQLDDGYQVWLRYRPVRGLHGSPRRPAGALVFLPGLGGAGPQGGHHRGLSPTSSHPVQMAWKALDVPQCGYCQSGQILAAAALLQDKPKPTDADIDEAMTNICRCGTYQRVRAAIHLAAGTGKGVGSIIHMAGLSPDQACGAGCGQVEGAKA